MIHRYGRGISNRGNEVIVEQGTRISIEKKRLQRIHLGPTGHENCTENCTVRQAAALARGISSHVDRALFVAR